MRHSRSIGRSRFLVLAGWAALVFAAAAGCERGESGARGMPPAAEWKPSAPAPSEVETRPGPGSAGGEGQNPHAGTGQGDPHAGLDLGGQGGGDPHAGLDLGEGMDPEMAAMEPPDPNRPIDKNKFLRGTIRAGADLGSAIRLGSVLFLSALPVDAATGDVLGAPVAVAKLTVDKLPLSFELTERDVMVAGTRFDGEVLLRAWVDGDGEARTKEPGDVEGQLRARVPAKGLELVLDTALR